MPRGVAPAPVGVVRQALRTALDVGSATMSSECSSSGTTASQSPHEEVRAGDELVLLGQPVQVVAVPDEWASSDENPMGAWFRHYRIGRPQLQSPNVVQLLWGDEDDRFSGRSAVRSPCRRVAAVGSGARLGRLVRSARPTVAGPAGRFGAAASVHVSGPGPNRRRITASRARRVRPEAGCRDRAVAGRCFRRRPATHSPEGGWPVRYPREG